jgi:hypothetical protein
MLISTLKQDELGEKQQLTRASLLGLLTTIKSYKEDSWTTTMGGLFAKIPKPIFNNKERYSNRIKLKTLKFERRLLEQELQAVIDKTESAA